jgi:hypothetical protein
MNRTPKHQLLQEFAEALMRRNPMNLKEGNPLEYEDEALSILSRFAESALQLADDEAAIVEVASNIIQQALDFWFDSSAGVNVEELARDLLGIYRRGFAVAEEEETPKVSHVTIG